LEQHDSAFWLRLMAMGGHGRSLAALSSSSVSTR
jgi:hypothetical protein